MRGGETFEAAVQDVMNRTSWLRDYLEDYRFTRAYWGRRFAKRRWQGSKPWKESSDASSPATVVLTLTQKSTHDARSHGHRHVPRGDHRRDTRPERTSKDKEKQACPEFQKGRCVTQGTCPKTVVRKCTVCDRTGYGAGARSFRQGQHGAVMSSARPVPDDEFCLSPTGAGVQEMRRRRIGLFAP